MGMAFKMSFAISWTTRDHFPFTWNTGNGWISDLNFYSGDGTYMGTITAGFGTPAHCTDWIYNKGFEDLDAAMEAAAQLAENNFDVPRHASGIPMEPSTGYPGEEPQDADDAHEFR